MHISQRLQSIPLSPTLSAAARVTQLQAQGWDIVSFTVGEPDFDTPDHIKEAAIDAVERGGAGKYMAVPGMPALRAAVAEDLSRVHGYSFSAEHVLVSSGAKHSLWNALMALIDDGDEVIVPVPTWPTHVDLVQSIGGVPRLLPTQPESGYQIDLDLLAQMINPRTRVILLCSPGNPTGAVLSEQTLQGIAALVRAQNNPALYVITDDLYRQIVYPPGTWSSLLRVAPDLAPQIVLIDGVSKAYAMTGWRIGFCAAAVELIEAMTRLQGQVTTSATAVAQHAALAAVHGDQKPVDDMRAEFDLRRRFMHQGLITIPEVRCVEPQGAFYCFPDVCAYLGSEDAAAGLPRTDSELADWLILHARVAVVAGSVFHAPGYLRLSYATGLHRIHEGLRRLSQGLAQLRPAAR